MSVAYHVACRLGRADLAELSLPMEDLFVLGQLAIRLCSYQLYAVSFGRAQQQGFGGPIDCSFFFLSA